MYFEMPDATMKPSEFAESRKGLLYALGCYLLWGLFPIYWYPLKDTPLGADQLLAWRIVWSAVFAVAVLLLMRKGGVLRHAVVRPKLLGMFALSSFCISMNWLIYLWAITNQHVLDASLGYFISPLFNIFLGRLVFKERLNGAQLAAIALAAVGVVWLAVLGGRFPWVAVLLTLTFGFYGLLRKLAPLEALPGLVLETLLMLPFAAGYLLTVHVKGGLVFDGLDMLQQAVVAGSGVATTVPLLLFAAGAKRIRLSTLGMVQYISPTMQMLAGLLLFGEVFDGTRFAGYVWVWLGVAVYLFGVWQQRREAV